MLQGRALYQVGHRDEGLTALREAIARASLTPDYQCVVRTQGTLALFLLSEDAIDQAEAVIADAIRTIGRQHLRGDLIMDALVANVQVAVRRLRGADTIHRGPLLREAYRRVRRALHQARVYAPGLPATLRMQAIVETIAGHADKATQYFSESERIAEQLGMRLELALTLCERGMLLGEAESKQRGEHLFGELLRAAEGVAPQ
jgi:hypothetical protein